MENSNATQQDEQTAQTTQNSVSWSFIAFIIVVIIGIGVAWQFTGEKEVPVQVAPVTPVIEPVVEIPEVIPEPVIEEPVEEVVEVVPEVVEPVLPSLDESDEWLKIKLPEMTWRKELLKLVIDEDMIRRFVVFTDNFAQGIVAYEHSPFTQPKSKFAPQLENVTQQNNQEIWQWNESSTRRFSLYVDLMRSMDSESLVQWYFEVKPLIDEAYSELGYGDEDFTQTLQDAITRVLDMELPVKSSMTLVRPSVMYQFSDPSLESLPESDKLLLRLGKDNLLVMKSILLELHEKLAQQENGVH
ncbi:MAG: DUF3014 domain-containing protein [Colwellia sp.]|nr:DUF3014 domain-containing protein [Colwellia sp.]MCW8864356.1 DUF3014 domain-containing protein [Colwellia sp.]MCW9081075.1 DUF3014 domain-containing protein [Colwellia sp.]